MMGTKDRELPDRATGVIQEGRLLADEEVIQAYIKQKLQHLEPKNRRGVAEDALMIGCWIIDSTKKAQRDLTASIKERECQARIEGISEEIEILHGKPFVVDSSGILHLDIPYKAWQALWEKEGVKQ